MEVTEVNDLRFQKSLHLGVDHIKMYSHSTNELSKCSEELTVYGWNTKVSAPFAFLSSTMSNTYCF